MSKSKLSMGVSAAILAAAMPLTQVANAFDYSVTGFIRQEMAYKFSDKENENNRGGSHYNGRSYTLDGALTGTPVLGGLPPGALTVYKGDDLSRDNDWNVFATKSEIDVTFTVSNNVSGFMKLRGYYQPDVFNDVDDSAFVDGEGGKVNHFNVKNHGNEATYLSVSNNDYMLDIPALYLDWASGPFWVRVGQQQIAWGEALFFRVADAPNGLDFRRHVIWDLGAEEYSDERLSAPGIRASMTFAENWELEVWAQMFQPTILPNNYTPYNLITNGFNTRYEEGFDKVDDNINAGVRLQGELGNLGVQFFAISRHNPDPIFNLAAGGQVLVDPSVCAVLPDTNPAKALCGFETQPFIFEPGGIGTTNPQEWFYLSAAAGSDGVDVINGLVDDWAWIKGFTQALGLVPDANGDILQTIDGGGSNTMGGLVPNGLNATDFLELFFATGASLPGLGNGYGTSLSGNLTANYASENIFGFGFNYIFYDEPDTWLDQLVVRFETSYIPNRKFSNNLRNTFIEEDEMLTSIAVEKYHRFSEDFPATFMVFQWMHRKESDLLGRHLSGLGGNLTRRPGGGEDSRGWDGLVLAFQQPFPSLVWRVDGSFMYDLNGGFFFQPAVRYKPNNDWTIEAFANFIDGPKDTIFSPFDYSDDVTLRLTYQF